MVRVVRPGGTVAAYAYDIEDGGVPMPMLLAEMRALGVTLLLPPRSSAARLDALRDVWTSAGLEAVETRVITVHRTCTDFADFWTTSQMGAGVGPLIAAMSAGGVERLKARLRARLPADATDRSTTSARANAIKGRVAT